MSAIIIPPCDETAPVPEGQTCQEASMFAGPEGIYVPCGEPAANIIRHDRDGRSYYMCDGCADHNVKNRGARIILLNPALLGEQDRPAHIPEKRKKASDVPEDTAEFQLAKLCAELKEKAEEKEEEAKEIWREYRENEVKLTALMSTKHIDLFRIPGFVTVSCGIHNHPSVVKADEESFHQWLDENGMSQLARRSVHPSTLKGWVNDRLKSNMDLPPMVKNFPTLNIRITKLSSRSKPKGS